MEQYISVKHRFNPKRTYNQLFMLTKTCKSKYVVIKCIMLTFDVFKYTGNHIWRKMNLRTMQQVKQKKFVTAKAFALKLAQIQQNWKGLPWNNFLSKHKLTMRAINFFDKNSWDSKLYYTKRVKKKWPFP